MSSVGHPKQAQPSRDLKSIVLSPSSAVLRLNQAGIGRGFLHRRLTVPAIHPIS